MTVAGPKRLEALRPLLAFLRRYRLRVTAAVAALLVAAGSVLTLGQALRLVVDRGFLGEDPAELNRLLLLAMTVILIMALASALRYYLVSWIGERVAADLRTAVFDHVTHLEPAFFELNGVGEIQSRLTTDTSVLQTILGSSFSIAVRNLLLLAGAVVMLFITSPRLTAFVLLSLPLVLIPILYFGRRVRRLSRASQDRVADVGSYAGETLHAIRTVQAFGHEAADRRRFRRHVDAAFATAVRRVRQRAWLVGMAMMLAFTAVGIILWQGGHDVLAGRMSAGELAAFVFYAVLAAGATGAVSEVVGELYRAAGATERLTELLRNQPRIRAPARPVPPPQPLRGAISLEGVAFAYPGRPQQRVLDRVDLRVAAGERVALVGPSGAGKSTVFALLLRFYDPIEGRVCLDGVDLKAMDPKAVRAAIGLVAQEPTLFTGTAWENIRYGREDADDADVRRAAEAAHCTEFLQQLPEGFDTPLGPGGVQLSGGQRQRIAIARAILRDPALLLLDEATSNLDADSEARIQSALEDLMRERTSLVIAHRLATVQSADRIVVMQSGRIQAEGSHRQLLRDSPLYAHLAALQFGSDPDGGSPGAAQPVG
ncbi:ABC transporter transmembrane domain-containing protein [Alkalilimnicola ehrlichii MLHE-1]|uniref:Lipid A ABC exporter family, fused ATPase and inner membrane subunits n=1 Tax=Alkalilimnicola ehrlichii (strain ATCC BAA-1101 / DSM 17681 / MLHE-1) TaxID=187272 RepID=Q0A8W8_ALKEH|nr:ABC transporter transmembrane domain-containing protein [Alkalilimnicola ehrlichii]ABI56719.1 lipid A ABC exporter family, fused ATPase and inner membrane subunits [Alkalilimnicola ehrlichii MLHE-1]